MQSSVLRRAILVSGSVAITFFLIGVFLYVRNLVILPAGKDLNELAWERSFTERGTPIPMRGPREGYWGSRITPKIADEKLGWRERGMRIPGLIDIDTQGVQRYQSQSKDPFEILIIGDSVAFGSYASAINTVYFYLLGKELDDAGLGSNISVFAAGGWRSPEELTALGMFASQKQPDLAIFLNGLNDLTEGQSAMSSFANLVAAQVQGGISIEHQYHMQDYAERVNLYLRNMTRASELVGSWKGQVLFVLQPALFFRKYPTAIEKKVLSDSLTSSRLSQDKIKESYDEFRRGLTQLATQPDLHFLDASGIFNEEKQTTFTDLWHFSDYGHTVLGHVMAAKIAPILHSMKRVAQQ